jgi:hypothetical protein
MCITKTAVTPTEVRQLTEALLLAGRKKVTATETGMQSSMSAFGRPVASC